MPDMLNNAPAHHDYSDQADPANGGFLVEAGLSSEEKAALARARESLARTGYYAYGLLNESQQWCVAVDDEAGRVDVWVERDDYVLNFRGVSPGLFQEEASDWRRGALERLARRVVPNIARGMLADNQSAEWSADDQGVAVTIVYRLPLDQVEELGEFVRRTLPEIDDLITEVESQLRS